MGWESEATGQDGVDMQSVQGGLLSSFIGLTVTDTLKTTQFCVFNLWAYQMCSSTFILADYQTTLFPNN